MTKYKGIILAGGAGSRLNPITLGVSKQLLPIYNKPMIYYSISVLMLSGIKEILIISTPHDMPNYKRLLGDGSQFGVFINYEIQKNPNGIAEAFIIGKNFIGNSSVALILGDNIFYGENFSKKLQDAASKDEGATIFGYRVEDPERFGVVEFNTKMKVMGIEEKPIHPKSDFAITGLYFYDNKVIEIAKNIKPSARGELEITDINKAYLKNEELTVELLGRGFAWLDTGTYDSLMEAGSFVQTIENRQGLQIACLEEIAYKNKWITKLKLMEEYEKHKKTSYGEYLLKVLSN